jgi:DNA-directed RNA polymerase specialized sigma subunit
VEEKLPPTWSPSYSVTTLQGSSSKLEPEEVPPVSIQESAQEQTSVITALPTSSGLQPYDEELAVIESLSNVKDDEVIHIQDEASSQPIVVESIVAQSSELSPVLGEVRSGSDQVINILDHVLVVLIFF